MGHHHRKHRKPNNIEQVQQQQQQDTPNADIGSMLQNLNLGDIDLSKVDMNKVQSIMSKFQNQGNTSGGIGNLLGAANSNGSQGGADQRVNMLSALKEIVPNKKAKKIDKILKLLQITNSMNTGFYPAVNNTNHNGRKRGR